MNRLITTLIGTVILVSITVAQPPDTLWTRTYSASDSCEAADCVRITRDGGFILSGRSHQIPTAFISKIYIVRTDSLGYPLWIHNYWRGLNDDADCIVQTPDGGFISTGHSTIQSVAYDIYWLMLDDHGNREDYTLLIFPNPDEGHCIQRTRDDNYVICGYNRHLNYIYGDAVLIKINPHGGIIWEKTYTGPSHENFRWVYPTNDEGFILAGATESYGVGGSDGYLLKANSQGDSLWSRTFGGLGNEEFHCVEQTDDFGFIIAGYTNSTPTGDYDFYLVKTDSLGNTDWIHTFGGTGNDMSFGVLQAMDGEYIVVGMTESFGAGGSDAYIIKVDPEGHLIWRKTLGGPGEDAVYKVVQSKSGNYYICGTTCLGAGDGQDAWLICLEPDFLSNPVAETGSENCKLSITHYPFNGEIVISFNLDVTGNVRLGIYNILGREVAQIINGMMPAGQHSIAFDGWNLASGIYFARLEAGGFNQTQKMVLMK